MFLQTNGNFDDATLVSGADSRSDGRGFVLFDYDRDGWIDMGVISPQTPRFSLYRNEIGEQIRDSQPPVMIGLRGGNDRNKGTFLWSNADGIGATLTVRAGSKDRIFLRSSNEGLASQNSKWIHVGMGQTELIDEITVQWPSGKTTTHKNIKAGSRVVLHEKGNTEDIDRRLRLGEIE